MDATKLIEKYYQSHPEAKKYLLAHSRAVAKKGVKLAERYSSSMNIEFVEEASLLHDIGIYLTYAPHIGCYGKDPYIRHGVLGRDILEKEGLPDHALVAERHIGVGLTREGIKEQGLPLPDRDMIPQTPEEEIVAMADLFFSKSRKPIHKEKNLSQIKKGLIKFGENKIEKFNIWLKKYGR